MRDIVTFINARLNEIRHHLTVVYADRPGYLEKWAL